jgi:hypothetical protein
MVISTRTKLSAQIHCAVNFFGEEQVHCSPLQGQLAKSCKSGSVHHAAKQAEVADVSWGLSIVTVHIALTDRVLLHTADTALSLQERSAQPVRSYRMHTISSDESRS